jgi:hypothetical protein
VPTYSICDLLTSVVSSQPVRVPQLIQPFMEMAEKVCRDGAPSALSLVRKGVYTVCKGAINQVVHGVFSTVLI